MFVCKVYSELHVLLDLIKNNVILLMTITKKIRVSTKEHH